MLIHGHVYVIYCNYIKPPKDKICLCVCNQYPFFFFINSNPRMPAGAQVEVFPEECAALKQRSYLDLSGVKTFHGDGAMNGAIDRGMLAAVALQRVRETLEADAPTLLEKHRRLALANLFGA